MIETAYLFTGLGAAAGASGGAVADMVAARGIARERNALAESWGPDVIDNGNRSALRSIGPVAITACLVGGIVGAAWAPEASPVPPRSQLEIVVDHSGATMIGESPSVGTIDSIVSRFDNPKVDTEAVVARSGEVRIISTRDVSKDAPFGDAPLDQAVQTALDNVRRARDQERGTALNKKAVTVVITNGNSIGSPADVIAKSKAVGTIVDIVNVEADDSSSTATDLKAIADQSGGSYFAAAGLDPAKVYEKVAPTLAPARVPGKHPTNWVKRALGTLPLAALPFMYGWRRRMAVTSSGLNVKGVK